MRNEMDDFASDDYQPTEAEIREFLDGVVPVFRPGEHGNMVIHASLEQYLRMIPGVYLGNRTIDPATGSISLDWLVPTRKVS